MLGLRELGHLELVSCLGLVLTIFEPVTSLILTPDTSLPGVLPYKTDGVLVIPFRG